MDDFFSFTDASKKVNARPLARELDGLIDGSQEAMDKSILLYTHMLKTAKAYSATHADDKLVNLLITCRNHKGKEIAIEDAQFFVRSLQDDEIWRQVADFYWSFCVIQYKIMTELKLLTNLDHVQFNQDGSIKGVNNIYGRADKDGRELLGVSLGMLVLAYFYDHIAEYEPTLKMVASNNSVDEEVDKHMNAWGHCLLIYLSIMMFGGGVINYKKFVGFCQDYNIGPETPVLDLYVQALEAFGVDRHG